MTTNPLLDLHGLGQSVWLDQITRDWLSDGQLAAWIEDDGVRGVTSNPTIFEQAIAGSASYEPQIAALAARNLDAAQIYDELTLDDIRGACDAFLPVYESTGGYDGYVSHEVAPTLAYDTWGTINEARRLWAAVDRPNLMIKIPATAEGLPAVEKCLTEGINVNVTLMFSMAHYEAVAEAYLKALEARVATGSPVDSIASVASFFISRVDSFVDDSLGRRIAAEGDPAEVGRMRGLLGTAAVANSKRAYRRGQELFTGARFRALEERGAGTQRLLWASTSTKNPEYSDVKYVTELIGPHTVNTLPLKTLEAFRDHGQAAQALTSDLEAADAAVNGLALLGIDLDAVGDELSRRGVASFASSFEGVLETVEGRRAELAGS